MVKLTVDDVVNGVLGNVDVTLRPGLMARTVKEMRGALERVIGHSMLPHFG
jgi:hypothetical protein